MRVYISIYIYICFQLVSLKRNNGRRNENTVQCLLEIVGLKTNKQTINAEQSGLRMKKREKLKENKKYIILNPTTSLYVLILKY